MQDFDFYNLKIKALARKRIKTNLIEHHELIKKMMDADISLPLIFDWLKENEVETALTTLRRFVKKTFGEGFYEDFSMRNGWQKNKQATPLGRTAGTNRQIVITTTKLSEKQKEGPNTLGNPGDINNFFNSRKS